MKTKCEDFKPHDWGGNERAQFFRNWKEQTGGKVPWWDGQMVKTYDYYADREEWIQREEQRMPIRKRYMRILNSLKAAKGTPTIKALREVVILHHPEPLLAGVELQCATCAWYDAPASWPCETFLAIERAYDGK